MLSKIVMTIVIIMIIAVVITVMTLGILLFMFVTKEDDELFPDEQEDIFNQFKQ